MDSLVIILLLSILGFLNAYFLYWQHKREITTGKKMFCLIGGDCGAVVSSKYGRTFGVKNEKIGMVYYFLLGLYVLMAIFLPSFAQNFLIITQMASFVAVLFSFYLLFVQAVILKTFCSWCLIAISLNLLIFYVV